MNTNIDIEKLLKEVDKLTNNSSKKEMLEKREIEKYHEGYRKGMKDIEDTLIYCRDYEKKVSENICGEKL